MGAVYEGYHTQIRKRVAIKIANPLEEDPILAKRLVVEAAAAGQIDHPNIAAVNDSGTTPGGAPFFVMEYLDGVDLEQVIRRDGPLDPARAVRIASQICKAAAAAHVVGVVHRDLKPSNVMLVSGADDDERVKVMDFGLAKFTRPQAYAGLAGSDGLTRPEAALGTPAYMAPEQLTAGAEVDARADIYALGVIAYEMLVGGLPFDGDDPEALAIRKLHEVPPPPGERRPGLGPDLSRAVMRALARNPADRPQTASEFAAALANAVPAAGLSSVQARAASTTDLLPVRVHRQVSPWLLGGGIAGLLVAGIAAFLWWRPVPPVPAPPAPRLAPTPVPVAPPQAPPSTPPAAPAATSSALPRPAHVHVTPAPTRPRGPATPASEPKATVKTAKELVDEGWDALEDSDTERAISFGRAALKAGGGGPAHFLLGKALLMSGLRREALAQFQQAVAANPKDKEAASMAESVRRLLEENP
jgi:serine/threonine-protein kinase